MGIIVDLRSKDQYCEQWNFNLFCYKSSSKINDQFNLIWGNTITNYTQMIIIIEKQNIWNTIFKFSQHINLSMILFYIIVDLPIKR